MSNYKKTLVTTLIILMITATIIPAVLASAVDESIVDTTAPTGSVSLSAGTSGSITINLAVTGKQDGTATFTINRDWALSGGQFIGSNPQTFTVAPRPDANAAATTFSTTGTVSVASGQSAGTFTLAVSAFDITNSNSQGAKLAKGASSSYQVIVQMPTSPLVLTAPADVISEATSKNGAALSSLGIAFVSGGVVPYGTISNDAPASLQFSLGTTTVTWTVTDSAGTRASDTQTITVRDTTAPTFSVPASKTVEGNTENGAINVDLGIPTVSDVVDSNPTVVNNAPSKFLLGDTTVTWTATDASRNIATSTQVITVVDTTAPSLVAPADVNIEGNTARGANVKESDLGTATAPDFVDPAPIIKNTFVDGFYALGTHTVTWTATDASHNSATDDQIFTVRDTTAPTITPPSAYIVEGNAQGGAIVTLHSPSVTDTVDENPSVTSDAPSIFPLGDTTVTWIAKDTSGNTAQVTQIVTVKDTTPPSIKAPASLTVEGNTQGGANSVNLGTPEVLDIVDASPIVSNDAPTLFPLGPTTITWTAKDHSGNQATATQIITVEDTTPPSIIAPASMTVEGNTVGGANNVDLGTPSVSDIVDANPTYENDAPNLLPLGNIVVIWTAKDASGNTATATQTITVVDTTPPRVTAPIAKTVEGNTAGGANIASIGMATAKDIVDQNPKITSNAPATGFYPLGDTTVTWTGTDASGNSATATQKITVIDTTAPATSLSSLDGTLGNNGWYTTGVSITLSAGDICSGVKNIYFTVNGGITQTYSGKFTLASEGIYKLVFWADDKAGNIEDKTAEGNALTINIDTGVDIAITTPVDGATYVLNQPVIASWTATDTLSGIVSKSGSVASGSPIDTSSVGSKTFTVIGTDGAGNREQKTVTYKVVYSTTYGGKILEPLQQVKDPSGLTKSYKLGSTLPIKFQLCDYMGKLVQANSAPTLIITKTSTTTDPADGTIVLDSGASNDNGVAFRYDTVAQQYVFNLSTKNLSVGTYRITVSLNDGSSIVTFFELKK